MKFSILLLVLLLVLCFLLPTILKTMEGYRTVYDASGIMNIIYDDNIAKSSTDSTQVNINSLTKSTTMDPDEDIETPTDDALHPRSFYANSQDTYNQYIAQSGSGPVDTKVYPNRAPVHSRNFEAGYYLTPNNTTNTGSSTRSANTLSSSGSTSGSSSGSTSGSSSGSTSGSSSGSTVSAYNSTENTLSSAQIEYIKSLKPSDYVKDMSTMSDASAENDIKYNMWILEKLSQFFRYNQESFTTIRVKDISNNNLYDISSNYELYNENGTLKKGIHDNTDYGRWFDSLNLQYKNLYDKYKEDTKPIKCIADFGTNVGEDLCCGQDGVLQNTKYVCPDTMPTCSKFECGSKFGTCSKGLASEPAQWVSLDTNRPTLPSAPPATPVAPPATPVAPAATPSSIQSIIQSALPSDVQAVIQSASPASVQSLLKSASPASVQSLVQSASNTAVQEVIRSQKSFDSLISVDKFKSQTASDIHSALQTASPESVHTLVQSASHSTLQAVAQTASPEAIQNVAQSASTEAVQALTHSASPVPIQSSTQSASPASVAPAVDQVTQSVAPVTQSVSQAVAPVTRSLF